MITYYYLPAKGIKKRFIVWKKTVTASGETHQAISGPISEASANSKIQKLQTNG
jgi:hypothetical protein